MSTEERIKRLEAHVKSRRGQRDYGALITLVKLRRKLAGQATHYTMNELLKNVYTDDRVPPDRAYVLAPHPSFAILKKEPREETVRYVVGIDWAKKDDK